MACAVPNCKPFQITHSRVKVGFHRFPSDEQIKSLWIKAIGKNPDWQPKSKKICSKHFSADCFLLRSNKHLMLKKSAVPNLYLPVDKSQVQPRSPLDYDDAIPRTVNSICTSCIEHMNTINTLQDLLEKAETVSEIRKRELQILQQRCMKFEKHLKVANEMKVCKENVITMECVRTNNETLEKYEIQFTVDSFLGVKK